MRYFRRDTALTIIGVKPSAAARVACKPASEVSRAAGTKHLTAVEIELQHPAVRFTVAVSDPDFGG